MTRSAELQTTPISRIFSGQLRSALHRQGSKATATVQSFFSLQLDIQVRAGAPSAASMASTAAQCSMSVVSEPTGMNAFITVLVVSRATRVKN